MTKTVWPRCVPAAVVGFAALGCGDPPSPTGLTPDQFADVIVDLRQAEREALETDSAAVVYERLKTEILERHGTSEEAIRQFVETSYRDLRMQNDLWESISERLRRPVDPPEGDSLKGRTPPPKPM